ncbi:phosphatase PAP2 family protein [Phytoactinopolyspora limicola]|uniref:phosphatase PAP2 family protein n=1 Tax=Phytoactinopolyspora limicola TaxID=2715536 RepID=UPI001A9C9215|nr:phosphatase PAP2 family protein [Phytoactinopolyspora limicola]
MTGRAGGVPTSPSAGTERPDEPAVVDTIGAYAGSDEPPTAERPTTDLTGVDDGTEVTAASGLPGMRPPSWRGWLEPLGRVLPDWLTPGRIGFAIYLAVLTWYCITEGLPIDRIGQTVWIVAGILAAGLGRTWHQHLRVFIDWIPLLAALVLYDHTRGIADTLGMTVRVGELVAVEQWLFGGGLPTVWLQERLYDATQVQWWDIIVAVVYFTHFVVPWAIAAVFYFRSRPLWIRYIRRVLLLTYAGLLTYILIPAAPPWYAARVGEISDEVARISTRGWWEVGLSFADVWLKDAQAESNPVAALPSLHAGFSLLVVVALWPVVGHLWGRWRLKGVSVGSVSAGVLWLVLALFPLAMAFTLVYGGEHYVADVLAGWLYVVLICVIAAWWEQRRPPWRRAPQLQDNLAPRTTDPEGPGRSGPGMARSSRA